MNSATFTGGSRVGRSYWMAWNESLPFTTLNVDCDIVELKTTLHGEISLKRGEIEKMTLGFYLMSFGLRLFHRRDDLPPYIVFWTFSPSEIRKAFETLNWELQKK
jgi:hypothetical protein